MRLLGINPPSLLEGVEPRRDHRTALGSAWINRASAYAGSGVGNPQLEVDISCRFVHLPRGQSANVIDDRSHKSCLPAIMSPTSMLRTHTVPMPSIVAWLGFGGLIPFVALAAATVSGGPYASTCRSGLLNYGAVILSFVGAVNWGFAMTLSGLSERARAQMWIWSVVPALIGWAALFLAPLTASMGLVAGFLAQFWQDRRLASGGALPAWYLPLRRRLTLGACICLAAGGFASQAQAQTQTQRQAQAAQPRVSQTQASMAQASLLAQAAAAAPDAAPAPTTSPYRVGRATPDGIGKFYYGREIAQVMGFEGAEWLERPSREPEERPDWLVDELRLEPGMVVADIGAGSGYLSRRMAPLVAPGRVFAVDVQPQMVELLEKLSKQPGMGNVVATQGAEDDVHLAAASVDLAVMVDVYHEPAFPYELMQSLVRAVRPGGRIVFVEYRAEDPKVPIKDLHKMSEAQLRREMQPLPLVLERTSERLPLQHVVVFRRR